MASKKKATKRTRRPKQPQTHRGHRGRMRRQAFSGSARILRVRRGILAAQLFISWHPAGMPDVTRWKRALPRFTENFLP